jgi:hypothetical protein
MTDMGRCRDCEHYTQKRKLCSLIDRGSDLIWSLRKDGLPNVVHIASDFGCVQFEKREDSNGD